MFRIDKLQYYDRFRCIMGKCPENCCEMNWNILVDAAAYERYQNCGEEVLRGFISAEEPHRILKKENRCPFFMDDGLCFLHKEYGEDFLCETCKSYPRFTSMYEDLYVLSLTPSCPAVLDILWEEKEPGNIKTELCYENVEELSCKSFKMSEELERKISLRDKMIEELVRKEGSLETRLCRIEERFGMGKRQGQIDINLLFIKNFVLDHCMVNSKIKVQAEKMIKSPIEQKENINIEEYAKMLVNECKGFENFFENILVYWIFEHILRIENTERENVSIWMERVRLMLATLQYWILLFYCVQGEVSREECNTAVYSIMRVLDHSDEMMEDYYQDWKNYGMIPKILC